MVCIHCKRTIYELTYTAYATQGSSEVRSVWIHDNDGEDTCSPPFDEYSATPPFEEDLPIQW